MIAGIQQAVIAYLQSQAAPGQLMPTITGGVTGPGAPNVGAGIGPAVQVIFEGVDELVVTPVDPSKPVRIQLATRFGLWILTATMTNLNEAMLFLAQQLLSEDGQSGVAVAVARCWGLKTAYGQPFLMKLGERVEVVDGRAVGASFTYAAKLTLMAYTKSR